MKEKKVLVYDFEGQSIKLNIFYLKYVLHKKDKLVCLLGTEFLVVQLFFF